MALSKILPDSLKVTVATNPSGNKDGRLFYNTTTNRLSVQDGTNTEFASGGTLGSEVNPASSAKALYDGGITTDGAYYIKNIWTGNVAKQVYCEFNYNFRALGTGYHLQKFDPADMQNTRYAAGASSSLTRLSSDLNDNTTYTWQFSTASSGSGAAHYHKTGTILSDLGQFFIRFDMNRTSSSDSNSKGEASIAFDSDNSGTASSLNSGFAYVAHFQEMTNTFNLMSVGYLMPSDTGTAAIDVDDIVCAYSNDQTTSIQEARDRLEGTANSTLHGTPAYQYTGDFVTTGLYLDIIHQGWSDTSASNTSQHMYWVAAEV